ncbi:MAG: hypothetical protein V4594_11310 [Bacteroidota bacterium]
MIDRNAQNKKNLRSAYWVLFLLALSLTLGVVKWILFAPKGWNESNTKELFDGFYEGAGNISGDVQQRKAMAKCFVDKIMVLYPNGIDELSADTLKKVSERVGMECTSTVTQLSWTPLIEKAILKKFKALDELKAYSEEKKTVYANCLLTKLKEKYPKGLVGGISQNEMDKVYGECLYVLK